ncbi:cobalamin biosynthesis protein [Nocardia cyriacigeorgica]|uniref:cobalamin biosynthesis protein n=1 Tax=Nocardia cyriacigeorgica TaxID=135487 RepID=UPI0026C23B14
MPPHDPDNEVGGRFVPPHPPARLPAPEPRRAVGHWSMAPQTEPVQSPSGAPRCRAGGRPPSPPMPIPSREPRSRDDERPASSSHAHGPAPRPNSAIGDESVPPSSLEPTRLPGASSSDSAPGRRVELAVGLGLRPGTSAERIVAAVRTMLGEQPIACLATVDRRAAEPGLRAAAAQFGVPISSFTAAELAAVPVPNPSGHAMSALGVPGVAEAAALLAGTGALVFSRRVVDGVVIAAAAHR